MSKKSINNGENQEKGQSSNYVVVENLQKTQDFGGKLSQNLQNQAREELSQLLGEVSSELSTIEKRDKQRGKSTFAPEEEQGGQGNDVALWKTSKLSTMDVDNSKKATENPFILGLKIKKNMANGVKNDGENMLFALISKLDFVCEKNACVIRASKEQATLLKSKVEIMQRYTDGRDVEILEIAPFDDGDSVEVEKITRYFGEEYVKILQAK